MISKKFNEIYHMDSKSADSRTVFIFASSLSI